MRTRNGQHGELFKEFNQEFRSLQRAIEDIERKERGEKHTWNKDYLENYWKTILYQRLPLRSTKPQALLFNKIFTDKPLGRPDNSRQEQLDSLRWKIIGDACRRVIAELLEKRYRSIYEQSEKREEKKFEELKKLAGGYTPYVAQIDFSLQSIIKHSFPDDSLEARLEFQYPRGTDRQELEEIENFAKEYPLRATYQTIQAILIANFRTIALETCQLIKKTMKAIPRYWIPIRETETFPIRKTKPLNTKKDFRDLASKFEALSEKYYAEANTLKSKSYGNLTNRRKTQIELNEQEAKRIFKYAFIFHELAIESANQQIDPILSTLLHEGAIDLFFKKHPPIFMLSDLALHAFINTAARAIKEINDPYETNKRKEKGKIETEEGREEDTRYLREFYKKYNEFFIFTMKNERKHDYETGEDYETGNFIGIDVIDHIDELHTATKIFAKYLPTYSRENSKEYDQIKRHLRLAPMRTEHFYFIQRKINTILTSEKYKETIKGIDAQKIRRDIEWEIVQGNSNEFFPTPPSLFKDAIRPIIADWLQKRTYRDTLHVLEPSAGIGTLAEQVYQFLSGRSGAKIEIDVVEYFIKACDHLDQLGFHVAHCGDFLEYTTSKLYNLIVMNPPFSGHQDIDHVLHAWTMLADRGLLVAIMSGGVGFRSDRKSSEFRRWVELNGGTIEKNDEGAFKSEDALVKTGVNTITLSIQKERG